MQLGIRLNPRKIKIMENSISNQYLNTLNASQKQAVETTQGALLVLAGAGTGKTSVLTSRISYILENGLAYPFEIMAVTFTNKAAKEMKTRIFNQVQEKAEGLFIGTFHSLSLKILRFNAEKIGLKQNFNIIDEGEQNILIKNLIEASGLDPKVVAPKLVAYQINSWKDKALNPHEIEAHEFLPLYKKYEEELVKINSIDFGGLILQVVNLLKRDAEVAQFYQNRFKYILVDEYQDTNVAQYLWLRLFAKKKFLENGVEIPANICCVGDDDQSIYGWRGAEIKNILRFSKDFDDAKLIRLEENYRSTQNILECANKVIALNQDRIGKNLKTNTNSNEPVKVVSYWDDKEEARQIAKTILDISKNTAKNIKKQDMAILVRAGHQTRVIEEGLLSHQIAYQVIGGLRFYDRLEIKDAVAYIKLLIDKNNDLAFERIINSPKRGVGKTTLDKIKELKNRSNISYFDSLKEMADKGEIPKKTLESVNKFFNSYNSWKAMLDKDSALMVVKKMLEDSGYIQSWKDEKTEEAFARVDNINELIKALGEFETLNDFLDHISLISDADNIEAKDMVNIITIHSAKGLEFNTVFLPGWEEGLFPSERSINELGNKGLEEERRLAYVAITRAKRNLYISFTSNRFLYGNFLSVLPSRFINELPKENTEFIGNFGPKQNFGYGQNRVDRFEKKPTHIKFDTVEKEAPKNDTKFNAGKFNLGQKIFHQKFGYGKVLEAKGDNITVKFDNGQIKILIESFLKVV